MIIPPATVAKESGINNFDGAIPCRRQDAITTGRKMITIDVLFRKAEIEPHISISTHRPRFGLCPDHRS